MEAELLLSNPPSQAEFLDWRTNRTTKYLIALKEAEYNSIKEEWAQGDFTRESVEATNQLNAKKLGQAEELWALIRDIETLGEDIEEEE